MGKVVFINSDCIGSGDEDLGRRLMGSFLYSLARTEATPEALVFMNTGVRLTCAGSIALDDITLLADDGVGVYSCGTCLDWLGLRDALGVGAVGNMNDSVAMLMAADDVVSVG
ncbi:MAG: sulfurtransferase-like selenium metabolism protein YedF [Coriobacteriia bacterium]